MEVLKKDGEEEGVELTEGSEDELGRGKKGRSPPPIAKAKSLYMTPYSIPGLRHPVAVVMTGLLGGATFVIALVSLASGAKVPIGSHETTTGFPKWTYTVLVSFILIGVFHTCVHVTACFILTQCILQMLA